MPDWVKAVLDVWLKDAGITSGRLFRCVNRAGRLWGERITEKVVWHVVRECAAKAAIEKLAPHDLRRTCARLCHTAGVIWNRYSSCLATSRYRPQSGISAVSNASGPP